MSRSEIIRFLILRSLGNFLVLVALYGVALTFGPIIRYEVQYQVIKWRHVQFIIKNTTATTRSVHNSFPKAHDTQVTPASSGPGFADILAGIKSSFDTN